MLTYFSYGKREYFESQIQYKPRRFWEFQAVVKGQIGQVREGNAHATLQSSRLWLSPPGSDHSWTGASGEEATIVVFHYRYLPESLATLIGSEKHIEMPLTATECRRLHELGARVEKYWNHPAPGMLLCYEHALLELSMLIYESLSQASAAAKPKRSNAQVHKALVWYNEHMHENPGLPKIAREANSSPANLRRLFHDCLQSSPKEVFDQLRYQRAMQLLTETSQSLSQIAEQCGFQDQSAFSRAFKRQFLCSPREIRSS